MKGKSFAKNVELIYSCFFFVPLSVYNTLILKLNLDDKTLFKILHIQRKIEKEMEFIMLDK